MPTATSQVVSQLQRSIARAIYGKEDAIQLALVTLLARGHLLIEDVPGVGKTTLAQAIAKSFHCSFQRIQFTSDLLPSDVLGVSVYNPESREFEFRSGPIFCKRRSRRRNQPHHPAHAIRASRSHERSTGHRRRQDASVAAAISRHRHAESRRASRHLPASRIATRPLFDAHQNGLSSHETEREILRKRVGDNPIDSLESIADISDVMAMQDAVAHVKVDSSLHDYALEIVNRTRKSEQLNLGVSPRGTLMLQRAAQARAFLDGRDYCLPDDFKQLAVSVFSHRVVASSRHASLQKKSETTDSVLRDIVESVPVPL